VDDVEKRQRRRVRAIDLFQDGEKLLDQGKLAKEPNVDAATLGTYLVKFKFARHIKIMNINSRSKPT
jgi:hypothetical protein